MEREKNSIYNFIYRPSEDSYLLLKHSLNEIKNSTNLNIIEIGIGSGFVISNLQKKFPENNYFGTDINSKAIEFTKKKKSKINLKLGDLFSPFKKNLFDIILFNTPYFPIDSNCNLNELSMKDRAIYGGKKGFETIEKFIIKSKKYFKKNGFAIMIISSLSNLDYIKKILEENLFEFEILEEENYFFEKIYCIKFYPIKILNELIKKKVSQIKFLTKGKHSIILEGKFSNLKSIIKIGKEKDIQIENEFLEKLKNEHFIPKLFLKNKKYSIMEKIEGKNIKEFLKSENDNNKIILIINEILKICKVLDEKKINKQEMTNPYKHIFITKQNKIKFIDFERCLYTLKPKNTTQFLQYLKKNTNLFKTKKIFLNEKKILNISKKYKKNQFEIKFNDIFK